MAEQNDHTFQVKVGPVENPLTLEVHPAAGDLRPWDNDSRLRAVKGRHPRLEAAQKVTGRAKYTYDVRLPAMLWAKMVRAPIPAGKILRIDTSKAERLPGVKSVWTTDSKLVRFAGQDIAWQLRNDFAVPGDTGTLVRLDDEGPSFSGRATLNWNLSERWAVRFLAAPLSTDSDYMPADSVLFQNTTFAAGKPIRVDYRFDSYRIGGVYRFSSSGPWSFRAGLTAKLRDAEISLRNDEVSATKSNTGVVPLLYGGMRYEASDRVAIDLDVDGAAAPQGRAIDAAIRVETRIAEST